MHTLLSVVLEEINAPEVIFINLLYMPIALSGAGPGWGLNVLKCVFLCASVWLCEGQFAYIGQGRAEARRKWSLLSVLSLVLNNRKSFIQKVQTQLGTNMQSCSKDIWQDTQHSIGTAALQSLTLRSAVSLTRTVAAIADRRTEFTFVKAQLALRCSEWSLPLRPGLKAAVI